MLARPPLQLPKCSASVRHQVAFHRTNARRRERRLSRGAHAWRPLSGEVAPLRHARRRRHPRRHHRRAMRTCSAWRASSASRARHARADSPKAHGRPPANRVGSHVRGRRSAEPSTGTRCRCDGARHPREQAGEVREQHKMNDAIDGQGCVYLIARASGQDEGDSV
jgi:hypothetical protein